MGLFLASCHAPKSDPCVTSVLVGLRLAKACASVIIFSDPTAIPITTTSGSRGSQKKDGMNGGNQQNRTEKNIDEMSPMCSTLIRGVKA